MTLGTFVGGTRIDKSGVVEHTFDVVDLDRDSVRRVPLDFLAHGFTTRPDAPHVAAVFEKRGPGAALIDLRAGKLLGQIRAKARRHYYGHGVFLGDRLFVIEMDLDTSHGVLSVRDTKAYKELDQFPTYGDRPHDCVPIDDGKVLVVTNGGGELGSQSEPSVCYVDVASHKLLEKVTFGDPKINAGHVAVGPKGELAVVSAPRDGLPPLESAGGITLRVGKKKPERMRGPDDVMAQVKGESLSVVIHRDLVAATNPTGGIVTFWSLSRGKLVGVHRCESPRGVGVTRDGRAFVLAYGLHASVKLLDVETLQPLPQTFGEARLGGSHLFAWDPV